MCAVSAAPDHFPLLRLAASVLLPLWCPPSEMYCPRLCLHILPLFLHGPAQVLSPSGNFPWLSQNKITFSSSVFHLHFMLCFLISLISIVVCVHVVETFDHMTTWFPPWLAYSPVLPLLLLLRWLPGSATLHHHLSAGLALFCNLIFSQGNWPQIFSPAYPNNDSPLRKSKKISVSVSCLHLPFSFHLRLLINSF